MTFLGKGTDSDDKLQIAVQLPQLKQAAASSTPNFFRFINKSGLTCALIIYLPYRFLKNQNTYQPAN
jgi:hypothetical protein